MIVAVLAAATDEACRSEAEEGERFAMLRESLAGLGARITNAWNLLGRFDYLLLIDVDGDVRNVFAVMSHIAQTGTMRTESLPAIPLEEYFAIARSVSGP